MLTYHTEPAPLSIAAELVEVYAEVFREAPYHEGPDDVREFADLYDKQARQPGFELTTGYDGARLVGFAYGDGQPPGWWWRDADRRPPEEVRGAAKFAVFEWAVLHYIQGLPGAVAHEPVACPGEMWMIPFVMLGSAILLDLHVGSLGLVSDPIPREFLFVTGPISILGVAFYVYALVKSRRERRKLLAAHRAWISSRQPLT